MVSRLPYTEGTIRDFLAKNLDVIEPGLQLVQIEYRLPNAWGSKGFIDILARDRHGILVVIELKRSDTAARQCIHELFKYTGLLAHNHGLRADELRCIAVSTDWHELLLPFSELYAKGSLQLSGYKLKVDADGVPLEASRISPIPPHEGTELCPEYQLFLYADHSNRQEKIRILQDNFAELGIQDYVAVEINYVKHDERVIYPFGICMALPLMGHTAFESMDIRIQKHIDDDCRYPIETAVSIAAQKAMQADELTISYPDKFVNMIHDRSWRIGRWHNGGRLEVSPVRTKESVLNDLAGLDSGQGTSFHKLVSPKNQIAWARALNNLGLHTQWCGGWKAEIFRFLEGFGDEDVSVSISLYAPDDMLTVLHHIFVKGDVSPIPRMEIIVSDETGIISVLVGSIRWNGRVVNESLADFLRFTFGGFQGYRTHQHYGEQRDFESDVCAFFGVDYATVALDAEQLADAQQGSTGTLFDLPAYWAVNHNVLRELESAFKEVPITGG